MVYPQWRKLHGVRMSVARALETAKIAIHWNHIIAPTDPNSGKDQEISWKGTAQKIAGLVILTLSTALIGAAPTMILFSIAIPYYTYTAYEKTHASSTDEKSPPVKQPLSEEEVDKLNQLGIDAILKASTEGKKVGLIIGRDKDQPVPVEDGFLWVAGNIVGDPAVLENRVDLQMDFNEPETVQKLQGLFDKVVVDFSTLKAIVGAWRFLRPMLKPLPESQLITELTKGICSIEDMKNDVYVDASQGNYSYSLDLCLRPDAEKFKEYARLEVVEEFRHYLKSLFNRVEIYDDKTPYPTREGCHTEKAAHFVLTGPAIRSPDRRKVFEKV